MNIDPDFASRADVFYAQLDRGSSGQAVVLGSFLVESLSPVTSSKVTNEGQPPFAKHRFSFELKDKSDAAWIVSCDVHMKWISDNEDESVQELSCDLLDAEAEGKLPYRLTVTGLGPVLGLKTGALTLGKPILEISSAHADASPPRQIGRLLGFEIIHDNRVFGSVQTVHPVTIWLERGGPEHLRSLAAACAVALAYYERVVQDA